MTRSRSPGPRSRRGPTVPPPATGRPPARDDVLAWLGSRTNFERQAPSGAGGTRSFGLGRMRRLLTLIGAPHRTFPAVHVAGTKGKGSTVAMIAAILERAGYRVGRYLSPHVHTIEERICVDGRPIPRRAFERSFGVVIPAVGRLDAAAARRGERGPTWFEAVTAAAFDHFAREKVDIAVVETGLGGRLDATNVFHPLVSVITPVSLDHTAVLGPTVRHIAAEKAGIVKRGCPVVCGARDPQARAVVTAVAGRRRARLLLVDRDFRSEHRAPDDPASLEGDTLLFTMPLAPRGRGGPPTADRYDLGMTGRHQADNAGMAVATVRLLRERGFAIPDEALRDGLATARLPARIERVSSKPLVVIDAAHNVASMRSLLEAIDGALAAARRRGGPTVLVFGASVDKEIEGMLAVVADRFDRIVLTRAASSPRSAPVERLSAACAALGVAAVEVSASPAAALVRARRIAGTRGMVCIAGSFFLAGEIGTP